MTTEKQRRCYDFILAYHRKHGIAPTRAEIRDGIGVTSIASVTRLIRCLVDQGLLQEGPGTARGITPVELLLETRMRRAQSYIIRLLSRYDSGALDAGEAMEALRAVPAMLMEEERP